MNVIMTFEMIGQKLAENSSPATNESEMMMMMMMVIGSVVGVLKTYFLAI